MAAAPEAVVQFGTADRVARPKAEDVGRVFASRRDFLRPSVDGVQERNETRELLAKVPVEPVAEAEGLLS